MARHREPVLVDTNVILEAFRVGAWRALSGGYRLETVEDCTTETQTGFQRRRPEQRIDADTLRSSFAAVHAVDDTQLAAVAIQAGGIALDPGEQSLWGHAMTRKDAWTLCGPDKASLRFGIRLGHRERLVALEWLLDEIGHRPKTALRQAYTASWHRTTVNQLVLAEGLGST